jgi:hypothetical protein
VRTAPPAPSAFPPLTCADVVDSPELAVLVVLAVALDATIEAIYAAHPELASGECFHDRPSGEFWVADAIVNHAAALKASLDTYRHAVECRRADRSCRQ